MPLAAHFGSPVPAPSLHVALETGTALIGLLATTIVVRGWRDGPRLDRLIIAAGLAVIAVTSAVLAAMRPTLAGGRPARAGRAHRDARRVAAHGVGAFAPPRRLIRPAVAAAAMVPVVLVALAAAAAPVEFVLDEWRGQQRPADTDPRARCSASRSPPSRCR